MTEPRLTDAEMRDVAEEAKANSRSHRDVILAAAIEQLLAERDTAWKARRIWHDCVMDVTGYLKESGALTDFRFPVTETSRRIIGCFEDARGTATKRMGECASKVDRLVRLLADCAAFVPEPLADAVNDVLDEEMGQ